MTAAAAQAREQEEVKGGLGGGSIAGLRPDIERGGIPPLNVQTILVLDFGSQFSQLIARRVREANVYCELVSGTTPWSELKKRAPVGLILSGGPASVYEPGAPQVDPEALRAGVPVLGICYGMQLIAHHLGGKVDPGHAREYGPALLAVREQGGLFQGLNDELPVWMSHGDHVSELPL